MWSFKSHPPLLPVSLFGRRRCSYLIVKRIQRQSREIKKVKCEFICKNTLRGRVSWQARKSCPLCVCVCVCVCVCFGCCCCYCHLFVCFLTSQLWGVYKWRGTFGSLVGKESACNARVPSSIPELGRSPGGGHGNQLQYSCLETPHGQRNLVCYCP